MNDSMDCFDDIQIEELQNFDFVGEDLIDLIEEEKDFNMKDYLNSNYDYWGTVLKLSTKLTNDSDSTVS